MRDEGITEEDLETLMEDFERVTEQYTEDGATSLHMSDGERFIVDGTLEEDVDEDYLPIQVKEIVPEIRDLFTNGTKISSENEDEYTITTFIEHQLDRIYGSRSDREARTVRTTRSIAYLPREFRSLIPEIAQVLSTNENLNVVRKFINDQLREKAPNNSELVSSLRVTLNRMLRSIAKGTLTIDTAGLVEFEETTSVYIKAEERRYVEEVLNQIIQNMARDFILNSLNRSPRFRGFFRGPSSRNRHSSADRLHPGRVRRS